MVLCKHMSPRPIQKVTWFFRATIVPSRCLILRIGWLGFAMMLGSFQCRVVLLLWHMVGQGPVVLAAGAGRVSYFFFFFFFFFISSILSSFSNGLSLGRRLDILKYCDFGRYNPTVVVSYYRRRARQVMIIRLVGLSLPRNSVNGYLAGSI